jgi:hypothetical protein
VMSARVAPKRAGASRPACRRSCQTGMPRGRWHTLAFNGPEEELEQFLAAQPSWLRKILLLDFSLTTDEHLAWTESDWWQRGGKVAEEYERLLRRVPDQWRDYCKRKKLEALKGLPTVPTGRPRRDGLAHEAEQLRRSGKSYVQTAKALNLKHGEGTTTPERIRKLLKSRKHPTPDKT